MKLWAKITNSGISLQLSDEAALRLEPSSKADQRHPRECYVYAHYDEKGIPFYIGKGIDRRAWKDKRHHLWHRYVDNHLEGKYSVRILEDNLSPAEAEELESEWIAQESETLVNWINFGRKTDFEALDRFHKLRKSNCELIASARPYEKVDPERAVSIYREAIENIADYAMITYEGGLIGQLLEEKRSELGYSGELEALDRLTLCLTRLRKSSAALSAAEEYFEKFRADKSLKLAETIMRRVTKAVGREG